MRTKIVSIILVICIMLGIFSGFSLVYAASVHPVSTLEELEAVANAVNNGNDFKNVKVVLTNDIVMNPVTDENGNPTPIVDDKNQLTLENPYLWTPIGTDKNPFRGMFDGKGYKIYGLAINSTANNQGLFGKIEGATIYNVFICDSYLKGDTNVGAVVGAASKNSIVSNCRNYNTIVYSKERSGGVVGLTDISNIYNCVNYGFVSSSRCSGGIVGDIYSNASANNCVNFGTVRGSNLVGGISGGTTKARINNCLNAGDVGSNGYMIAGGAGDRVLNYCYSVKNSQLNTNLSMGTSSKTAVTFNDETSILTSSITVNNSEYTKVVDAMNAWVAAQTDGIYYSTWSQDDSYPYLTDTVIGSVKSMNPGTFDDVDPEDWYYDEVKYVYDNGLMSGVTEKEFYPEYATSRAMVVTILYRQEGEPAVGNKSFSDIQPGQWYSTAIAWGAENGIVAGFTDGTFGPDQPITREQMAAIIYRYAAFKGLDTSKRADLSIFPDGNTVSGWAKENVAWAVGEKLINGSNGRLYPQAEAARSQVATILKSYCTTLAN